MYNASISSINQKVLTVHPKWHYYVPYLINFSKKLKRNNCSFKCYHIVASLKELVVPLCCIWINLERVRVRERVRERERERERNCILWFDYTCNCSENKIDLASQK